MRSSEHPKTGTRQPWARHHTQALPPSQEQNRGAEPDRPKLPAGEGPWRGGARQARPGRVIARQSREAVGKGRQPPRAGGLGWAAVLGPWGWGF